MDQSAGQPYRLSIATPPDEEPVTLASAKEHVRVAPTMTEDDALLTRLIQAARERIESEVDRALITQTLDVYLDCFPASGEIVLPRPPIQSVTWVRYHNDAGTLVTLPTSQYVATLGTPGRICVAPNATWPTTQVRPDAVTIRYVAGYGAAAAVPATVQAAILLMCGTLYKYREEGISGTIVAKIPTAVDALLDPVRWGPYR